jgi:hypothetical protein
MRRFFGLVGGGGLSGLMERFCGHMRRRFFGFVGGVVVSGLMGRFYGLMARDSSVSERGGGLWSHEG